MKVYIFMTGEVNEGERVVRVYAEKADAVGAAEKYMAENLDAHRPWKGIEDKDENTSPGWMQGRVDYIYVRTEGVELASVARDSDIIVMGDEEKLTILYKNAKLEITAQSGTIEGKAACLWLSASAPLNNTAGPHQAFFDAPSDPAFSDNWKSFDKNARLYIYTPKGRSTPARTLESDLREDR